MSGRKDDMEAALRAAREEIEKNVRIKPGTKVSLKDHGTDWPRGKLKGFDRDDAKQAALEALDANTDGLRDSQELLWADGTRAVLVILQGLDASGKDGIVKHVMSGMSPAACRVTAFKVPSDDELAHTFLWRQMREAPPRGQIGIFNRSHYEEVLVAKVEESVLRRQRLGGIDSSKDFWDHRYEDINNFELHLARNGTAVVKFLLHISKEEQRQRLMERLDDKSKRWKFSSGDLGPREKWDEYREAMEEMLSKTSTEHAPWYVVPADRKWAARAIVSEVLVSTIRSMNLKWPEETKERREDLERSRRILEGS